MLAIATTQQTLRRKELPILSQRIEQREKHLIDLSQMIADIGITDLS
jgi:hypothetical protein